MADFSVHEKTELLYSEGAEPVKSPIRGLARRMLSAGSIPLVLLAGLGLSPPKAKAQDGYIAGVQWCQSSPPSEPYHFKISANEVDSSGNPIGTGYKWTSKVPSSIRMINITGLKAGSLYEVRALTCITNSEGTGACSVYSANKPLLVARLYGNSDVSSNEGTRNRVDFYDYLLCVSVARSPTAKPDDIARCDFNGNGVLDAQDFAAFGSYPMGSFGKVQANLLGTNYLDCTTPFEGGPRCPETATCGEIPYGRAESTTLAAIANPESLLRKQPDGSFILAQARGRSSSLHERSEFEKAWHAPWEGHGRRDAYERKPNKLATVFNYSAAQNNYRR